MNEKKSKKMNNSKEEYNEALASEDPTNVSNQYLQDESAKLSLQPIIYQKS